MSEKEYIFITIDIVRDFVCEEGIFCKAFGYEDVSNIINVKDKVLECLNYVKDQASDNITVHHSICCQSVYKHKQFKSPGLEDLCVTVQGQECTIPDDCFDYRVIKTTNSILDLIKCETIVSSSTNDDSKQTEVSPKDAFIKLLSQYKGRKNLFIILLGVTTNSCVKTSAMNMTDLGFNVIIPLDCVACRKSTEPSATNFLKKTPSVSTVSSWTDLFANN